MSAQTQRKAKDAATVAAISRVTWIGFWINAFLSAFKIVAGVLGNSRAVVADGVHSLSDLITDIALLVGVHFWVAPPDEAHPYGHKRLESLVTLLIGVILAVAGVGIAVDAIQRMDESIEERVGGLLALSAAVSSVIIKESLYRWTLKRAKELKSSAVEANAWDHRSDALSSIPVVLTVSVATWFPALAIIDLIGAVVVACFIEYAAWNICKPAINTLLDRGADAGLNGRITEYVLTAPGVKGVHALRSRYLGQDLVLDVHICVDAKLTVAEGNAIAHALEDILYSEKTAQDLGVELSDAVIHVDPWFEHDPDVR